MNTLKKIIQLVLVILTLSPLNTFCQIIYLENEEIIFSDTEYRDFIPIDILHTNNKIYVYTYQKILIFNESLGYQGDIDFSNQLGKFAPLFYSPDHYSTDIKLMTVDEGSNELYFISPNITVKKVSTTITDPTNSDIIHVLDKPVEIGVSNLVGFGKIEFAEGRNGGSDQLIWFLRIIANNNHSFDSFVGVYMHNGSAWEPSIHREYLHGNINGEYERLVSNITFSPDNEDFYLTRKFEINLYHVVQNVVQEEEPRIITTNQERSGKLLFVQNNGADLLIVFPHWVTYDESANHSIYQINTQTRQLVSALLSPSKRILDAIYSASNEDILMCYADDGAVQSQPSGYDVAWMHFNSLTNRFYFDTSSEDKYLLSTQAGNEVDLNPFKNYNVGFKFLELPNNNILLSKKNEIVRLEKNGSTYFSTNEKYSRDSYFYKGVNTSNAAYIISQTRGIENITSGIGSPLTKTINPVYNTESNPLNRKLYFFNRLSSDNTGFYVYDLDTETIETFIETPYPIGDLKYNKFQNHILVTQYCESSMGTPSVRIYNAETNDYLSNISFSTGDYPSRMLVAPNGYIYYSSDTKYDNVNPKINIVNASTYEIPTNGQGQNIVIEVNMSYDPEYEEFYYNYTSFFCYNPYNNTVYSTFSPYGCGFPTYHTSFHSTKNPYYGEYMNMETTQGKLISIDENFNTNEYTGSSFGEVICAIPLIEPTDPGYKGKLYINGTNLYTFDCNTNSLTSLTGASNLYDIDYNPVNNCLYGLKNLQVIKNDEPDKILIQILKVNEDNEITYILSDYDENIPDDYHGIGSSLTYNKFDDQLYLYFLSDEALLGGSPVEIVTLDPYSEVADPSVTITDSKSLPYRNFFPEITPQANFPYFDEYNNKAYFPNGFNSSVSVIEFTYKEALPLVFGENHDKWMSVPRMVNNMSDDYNEGDYVETVFDKGRFGIPYTTFELTYENPENDVIEKATWDAAQYWVHDQEDDVFSYRGYIMKLNSQEDNYLYMYGQIKDPATSFPIYPQKLNPIGYFLPQEQDVFDALGTTTLSLIDEIRSQEYYCEKQEGIIPYGPTGGSVGQIESYYWVCDKHQTNIKYGDMIMVHSSQTGAEEDMIQWQNGPGVVREKIRPETEYFSCEQVNNYTPFIIELNYDVNPLELGAFINSKCVGATALMSEDSIVFMRVYLDGADPDSIVFQDWNGTKSSGKGIIRKYKVFNELTKTFENRILKGDIGTNKVRISFKNANNNSDNDKEINNNSFMIWPNPANNKLYFSIQIDESTLSQIELMDISGRKIALLYSGLLEEGYNSGNINLCDLPIKAGIYFVKIKAGSLIQTKKLIINK